MKLNTITSVMAMLVSALIAYGFYSFNDNPQKILLTVGSFALLSLTLIFTIGIRFEYYHRNLNVKGISIFFFSIILLSHVLFSYISFSVPVYIVTHGLLLMLYIFCIYVVQRPRI